MILTQRLRTVTVSKAWCYGHYLLKFCISLNNLFLQENTYNVQVLHFSLCSNARLSSLTQFPLNLLFVWIEEF